MQILKKVKNYLFKDSLVKNLNVVYFLCEDFGKFLENRQLVSLLNDEIFSKFLNLHFKVWSNSYKLITQKNKLNEWSSLDGILRNLDFILKTIIKRAIMEKGRYSFLLFKNLKFHIGYYQKKVINEYSYANYFFRNIFCSIFFEYIVDSSDRFDIREHYFPKEWKITKENIKNSLVSRILWNQYVEWAQKRIMETREEKFDRKLDEVTSQLFPNIDYSTWAEILTFAVAPWSDGRIKSAIERKIIFGAITLYPKYMNVSVNEIEKVRKERINNTIKLGYILLRSQFSKKALQEYLQKLEELGTAYPPNSSEEAKRMNFLKIFKEMLNLTNKYEGK